MTEPIRVALVNLRAEAHDWSHIVMVPLGLLYVGAALRRAFGDRVRVSLHDMNARPTGEFSVAALRSFLQAERPDVVGIRGLTSQAAEFPRVSRIAREIRPDCLVVVGGPHAATRSPALFREETIDLVCVSEGEAALVEVVGAYAEGRTLDGIPGIGRLVDGKPVVTPRRFIEELDGIASPDYSLIDLDAYQGWLTMTDFRARARYTTLFTSRGCPYRCTYCHDNFGKEVRVRSAADVLAEIEWLMGEHGVREFHILDDIFNFDRERAMAIFDEIVRRNWRIRLAFPNGLRADRMDEEFVAAARAAGTYHWALAVETATPRLQKAIRKMNRLDRVFETIRLADRHEIFTTTFNMLGFPTETEEEMRATIEFSARSAAHLALFFVVTPYERTALHEGLSPADLAAAPDAAPTGCVDPVAFPQVGSLSPVPRQRLEEILGEAIRRVFFADPWRIRRMLELSDRAHDRDELAFALQRRLHAVGLTPDTVPHPEARALLKDLFGGAWPPARAASSRADHFTDGSRR